VPQDMVIPAQIGDAQRIFHEKHMDGIGMREQHTLAGIE
jgi:hypothetical protein